MDLVVKPQSNVGWVKGGWGREGGGERENSMGDVPPVITEIASRHSITQSSPATTSVVVADGVALPSRAQKATSAMLAAVRGGWRRSNVRRVGRLTTRPARHPAGDKVFH